ncbi:MAG: aminotransferase class IV [Alphaproteobacteria bacterium]|nr:aminotransferase class IV [Alphaproteobacteria bacterium]
MIYWLNGDYREDVDAINISERGFLLGDGVFETLLVRNGVAAFQDEHLARLHCGLEALKIITDAPDDIGTVIQTLIKKSGLENSPASLRISVARGPAGRGLKFPKKTGNPTTLITVQEMPQMSARANALVALKVSQFARSEKSITARHKTLNYLDNILAHNDALDSGSDDAVMLNGAGRVACAPTSNIYVLDDVGTIRTPPIEEGALPGIVRGLLLQSGTETGVEICEAPVELVQLQGGHVFLSNSLFGLRLAALSGNNNPWPTPAIKILQRVQTWYDECLRNDLAARAPKQ